MSSSRGHDRHIGTLMDPVIVDDTCSSVTQYTKSTQSSQQSQLSDACWGCAFLTLSMADQRQLSVTNSSTPVQVTYFLRNMAWPEGTNVEEMMIAFGWMSGEAFLRLNLEQIKFALVKEGTQLDQTQKVAIVILVQAIEHCKYESHVCLIACANLLTILAILADGGGDDDGHSSISEGSHHQPPPDNPPPPNTRVRTVPRGPTIATSIAQPPVYLAQRNAQERQERLEAQERRPRESTSSDMSSNL